MTEHEPRSPFNSGMFVRSFFVFLFFLFGIETGAGGAEIKYGGEFRARGFYDDNLTDAHDNGGSTCRGPAGMPGSCRDQESFGDARFRLKIMATEDLATGVVLVDFFNGNPGRDAATLNSPSTGRATSNRILGSQGFGQSLDAVRLREGYLRLSWPQLHLVIGRQGITLGYRLVLDDTADAVSLAIPIGWANLTFMDLFLNNTAGGTGSTSAYLANLNIAPTAAFGSSLFTVFLKDRGPSLSFNRSAFFNPCGIGYASVCRISNFGTDQATLLTVGWAMGYKGTVFHWDTELDYFKGSIRSHHAAPLNPSGREIKLNGANALAEFGWRGGRIDALLTGLYATGQKAGGLPPAGRKLNINAISPNFVLGNILVNNESISDRDGGDVGGLTAAKLVVGWRPAAMVRGELAGIWARLTKQPATDSPRNLGWELDANASWQMDPHVLLTAGFGMLFPGEAWTVLYSDPGAKDKMIKASTKLIYNF